jgi:ABC-type transport system involved in multi-copper enzyme maturation permease subunit
MGQDALRAMTFLPIVARELRVTSRKARTYWSRTGVAALMLSLASYVFLMVQHQAAASQAMALFGTLAGATVIVGGLSGIGATADTLSSEKREGTLGLLFLTPLRGYDVVLGKLCAGSLSVLYGMVSVTPILALPLLMGGVSGGEFGRMALLMVNTMLLSLATGICVSSVSRDEKRARGAALLVMVLLAGGFPLVGAWLEYELKFRGVAKWFLVFSPGYAFAQAWDSARGVFGWRGFWSSMLVLHGLTWLFLLLACWLTPRTWQDRPVRSLRRLWGWFRMDSLGSDAVALEFRRRLLDQNAFGWLTARPRSRPLMVWLVLLAVTGVWLGFGLKYPREMFDSAMFVCMALCWNGLLKCWVASEATRQIAVDRRAGSIELLLSTPLTVADLSRGLWLSLRRQFGGPLVAVLAAEGLLLSIGLGKIHSSGDDFVWGCVWLCGMTVLVADLLALYAVGLWQSAVAKGPAEAAGSTALRILVLPWLLFMLLGAGVSVADAINVRGASDLDWGFWLGSWTLIGLGVDLLFGWWSWRAVQTRFREVAASRAGARGWGDFFRRLAGSLRSNASVSP